MAQHGDMKPGKVRGTNPAQEQQPTKASQPYTQSSAKGSLQQHRPGRWGGREGNTDVPIPALWKAQWLAKPEGHCAHAGQASRQQFHVFTIAKEEDGRI